MRYTKTALLAFGLGLLLGLVVVTIEVKWLERLASGLMAFGIGAIPIGMIMDWRRAAKAARWNPKRRAKAPVRRAAAATSRRTRPRKPARPNR
jgi:hypothetical protein